ncbi:MAG TPA: nitronate monooxygenase [Sphingomicrobium sp.]|jgi:nitronate monooxygenase
MGVDAEQRRMVGWPNRRFLDLVGTQHPIIQAPMANVAGVELCVAAARAGALGSLPCGMITADQAREQIAEVRSQVHAPVNLNFFCFKMPPPADDSEWRKLLRPYYAEFGIPEPQAAALRVAFDDAYCRVVEETRPEVVSFHFGFPETSLLERVRSTGASVIGCATDVAEALYLQHHGADAIIAQGLEAGGHSGRFLDRDPSDALGLFALLPQIVDVVSVPVIAAGAIADGRGVAAAFALGASAVQVGSAYLQCPESFLPDGHKAMLRRGITVMTNVYSGGLARAVRGRLVDELGPIRQEAPPYPLAGAISLPLFRAALEQDDYEFMPSLAGQNAYLGNEAPAEEVTRKLAADALAILEARA